MKISIFGVISGISNWFSELQAPSVLLSKKKKTETAPIVSVSAPPVQTFSEVTQPLASAQVEEQTAAVQANQTTIKITKKILAAEDPDNFFVKQKASLDDSLQAHDDFSYIVGALIPVEEEIQKSYKPEAVAILKWRNIVADSFEQANLPELAALSRNNTDDSVEVLTTKILSSAPAGVAVPQNNQTNNNNQNQSSVNNELADEFLEKYRLSLKDNLEQGEDDALVQVALEVAQKDIEKVFPNSLVTWQEIVKKTFSNTKPKLTKNLEQQTSSNAQAAKKQSTYAVLGSTNIREQVWQKIKAVGFELGLLKKRVPLVEFLKKHQAGLNHYFMQGDLKSVKQVLIAGEENVRYWYPNAALSEWNKMVEASFTQYISAKLSALNLLDKDLVPELKKIKTALAKCYPMSVPIWEKKLRVDFFEKQFENIIASSFRSGASLDLWKEKIARFFPEHKALWDLKLKQSIMQIEPVEGMSGSIMTEEGSLQIEGYKDFYTQVLMPMSEAFFVSNRSTNQRLYADIDKFADLCLKNLDQNKDWPIVSNMGAFLDLIVNLPIKENKDQVLELIFHQVYFLAINVYFKTNDPAAYKAILAKIASLQSFQILPDSSLHDLIKLQNLSNRSELFNRVLKEVDLPKFFLRIQAEIDQRKNTLFKPSLKELLRDHLSSKIQEMKGEKDPQQKEFALKGLVSLYKKFVASPDKSHFDFEQFHVCKQSPADLINKMKRFFAGSADYFKQVAEAFKQLQEIKAYIENLYSVLIKSSDAAVATALNENIGEYLRSDEVKVKLSVLEQFFLGCSDTESLKKLTLMQTLPSAGHLSDWFYHFGKNIDSLLAAIKEMKNDRIKNFYRHDVLALKQDLNQLGQESAVKGFIEVQINFSWKQMLNIELASPHYNKQDKEILSRLEYTCREVSEDYMIGQALN